MKPVSVRVPWKTAPRRTRDQSSASVKLSWCIVQVDDGTSTEGSNLRSTFNEGHRDLRDNS